MPPTAQSLFDIQIGPVTLFGWEVPSTLPNLFGIQKVAVHDFAGGQRTVQQLGAFTMDHIEWQGSIFNGDAGMGMSCEQRSSQLNQLRYMKTPVTFLWGQFNMTVIVTEFEIMAKMFQQYDYRIKLLPIVDNTSTANTPDPPLPETILTTALNEMTSATTSPASGVQLPAPIVTTSNQIQSDIANAMTAALQVIANIPTTTITTIQQEILALQLLLDAYDGSVDYPEAAAAINLAGATSAVSIALGGSSNNTIQQITVINPNLLVIASQFYGSPTYWTLIASANFLQDYQLQGSYTLIIPPITANDPFVET